MITELIDLSDTIFYCSVDSGHKILTYNSLFKNNFDHHSHLSEVFHPEDLTKVKTCFKGKNVTVRVKRGFDYELVRIVGGQNISLYSIVGVFLKDTPHETRAELSRVTRLLGDVIYQIGHVFLKHVSNIEGGHNIIEGAAAMDDVKIGLDISKRAAAALRESFIDGTIKYKL